MKKIFTTIVFLLVLVTLSAHPWKPRHFVIIDTDGGLDDQKAICMLLASPDVRVLGITVSEGFHKEETAYDNIRSLLDNLWHEGLPVIRSDNAASFIEKCLSETYSPVSFIALGSLKTVAAATEGSPSFLKKIKIIYWSNDGLPGKEGLNYRCDPPSAEKVLTGPLPVMAAGKGGSSFYNDKMMSDINDIFTPYAIKTASIVKANASHAFAFTAFDEMMPILLHYPAIFLEETTSQKNRYFIPSDIQLLRDAALTILRGETVNTMQVIKHMPSDTSFYMADIQVSLSEIIRLHGEDEWTCGVIANELHRHLGVFAIIGVKMGIRAREYFCTGVDEMSVLSHAGTTPPLSCMNDGVQVSTGATPGHGLLAVSSATPAFAAADFTYMGKTIRISLKKDLSEKVSSELKEINFVHGLDSDVYWELVRQNSIKYWLQFDRHEIFDIEIIK